jgi:hypothetical protein
LFIISLVKVKKIFIKELKVIQYIARSYETLTIFGSFTISIKLSYIIFSSTKNEKVNNAGVFRSTNLNYFNPLQRKLSVGAISLYAKDEPPIEELITKKCLYLPGQLRYGDSKEGLIF